MYIHTYMDFYSYLCKEDRLLIPNGGCLNLAGQSFIIPTKKELEHWGKVTWHLSPNRRPGALFYMSFMEYKK